MLISIFHFRACDQKNISPLNLCSWVHCATVPVFTSTLHHCSCIQEYISPPCVFIYHGSQECQVAKINLSKLFARIRTSLRVFCFFSQLAKLCVEPFATSIPSIAGQCRWRHPWLANRVQGVAKGKTVSALLWKKYSMCFLLLTMSARRHAPFLRRRSLNMLRWGRTEEKDTSWGNYTCVQCGRRACLLSL